MITAIIRDIAIIIIAIQSIVIGLLIGILVWQVWRLIRMIQTEIKPIIEETQETVNTVRGTTSFVSNNLVQPIAKTGGYLSGAREMVRVLGSGLVPPSQSRRRKVVGKEQKSP